MTLKRHNSTSAVHYTSVFAPVIFSQLTAFISSALYGLSSPPSNFMTGHSLTTQFMLFMLRALLKLGRVSDPVPLTQDPARQCPDPAH